MTDAPGVQQLRVDPSAGGGAYHARMAQSHRAPAAFAASLSAWGPPAEIVAIARHIAGKEKIAISEQAWPLLEAEAARLRSLPTDSGTALDVAGKAGMRAQGCYRLQEGTRPPGAHRRTGRAGQVRPVGVGGQRRRQGTGVGVGITRTRENRLAPPRRVLDR